MVVVSHDKTPLLACAVFLLPAVSYAGIVGIEQRAKSKEQSIYRSRKTIAFCFSAILSFTELQTTLSYSFPLTFDRTHRL